MGDEAVNGCLAALKFVAHWFVASKVVKILFNTLFNEDSGNVIFNCNGIVILDIDFNNINLDNTNYAKDDPDPIIVVKLLGWHIKFEKCKALKKRSVKN